MKLEKIFNIYKDFSEEELLEFKKFLKSPFFVNNKSLSKIFDVISINKNLLDKSEFDKLLKKLSKKLKHSSATIVQRLSLLNKETLYFFKIKSLLSDSDNSELSLNKYLLKNKHFSVLRSNLEKSIVIQNNTKYFSDNYFWYSFNYNLLRCDFLTGITRFADNKSAELRFSYLIEASTDLSTYYLIQQINLFANYVFLNVDSGNHKKSKFPVDVSKIIHELDKNIILNKTSKRKRVYELYKLMFLAIYRKNNTENYIKYKSCFEKSEKFLCKDLINYHFNILLNYCVMKHRLGEEKDFYRKQQVELLLNYIEKDYFKTEENEYLHPTDYRNFILIAYSIPDYKLLKYFIDKCTSKLNKKDYNDMLNFGLSYYYYGMKNYRKAWKSINNIEINSFIYRFDIRNIILRLYFDAGKYEELRESMHNYKKSIRNDKMLNESNKESLLKLLKYLNKLIPLLTNPNLNLQEEAEYLFSLVEKEPTFALKKWLLEKLGNITNSSRRKEMKPVPPGVST
jgi:hypothetical protein